MTLARSLVLLLASVQLSRLLAAPSDRGSSGPRLFFEDDADASEAFQFQVNKDIDLLYLSVDLSSLLSIRKWGNALRRVVPRWGCDRSDRNASRADEGADAEAALDILSDVYAKSVTADPFLRTINDMYIQQFVDKASIADVPFAFYIEAGSASDTNLQFRYALGSERVMNALNDRYNFYVGVGRSRKIRRLLRPFLQYDGSSTVFGVLRYDAGKDRCVVSMFTPDERREEDLEEDLHAFLCTGTES